MSIFNSIMQLGGVPAMTAALADELPAIYRTPEGKQIEWLVIVAKQKGTELWSEAGDKLKTLRLQVTGSAAPLLAAGVSTIELYAEIELHGEKWNIEADGSEFGASAVRLSLSRRFKLRHEELEAHGTV